MLLKLYCIIVRKLFAAHTVSAVASLENIRRFTSNHLCLSSVTSLSFDLQSGRFASPASSNSQRRRSCRNRISTQRSIFYQTVGKLRIPFKQLWPWSITASNLQKATMSAAERCHPSTLQWGIQWIVDGAELVMRRAEKTRIWVCQSFPMSSIESTLGENSQSRELRPVAAIQEIRSRGF